mmetsp:Transcript_26347/g.85083  ORF Transcript_26347/g.85083 Transcript_26347/m.85083 type:complete len:231 (-) Transcript_26347:103-795(-)
MGRIRPTLDTSSSVRSECALKARATRRSRTSTSKVFGCGSASTFPAACRSLRRARRCSRTPTTSSSPRGARSRAARLRNAAEGEASARRAAAAAAAASAGARARAVPRAGRARTPKRARTPRRIAAARSVAAMPDAGLRRRRRRLRRRKSPRKLHARRVRALPGRVRARSFAPNGRRRASVSPTCVGRVARAVSAGPEAEEAGRASAGSTSMLNPKIGFNLPVHCIRRSS